MKDFLLLGNRFLREEHGQDPVEYGLLLGLVALLAAAAFPIVTANLQFVLQAVGTQLLRAGGMHP